MPKLNPFRGILENWQKVSAPHGLNYRVNGILDGLPFSTGCVMQRDEDTIETLNWTFKLGRPAKLVFRRGV